MTPVIMALDAEGIPCYIGGSVGNSILGLGAVQGMGGMRPF